MENWSAFTPDFRELDENVEYEERESEFDLEDEDKTDVHVEEVRDENDDVDVLTVEKNAAYCSSDEEQDDATAVLYIPITPEIEEPEDAAWLSETFPELAPPPSALPPPPKNSRGSDSKRSKSRKDSSSQKKKTKTESSHDSSRHKSGSQSRAAAESWTKPHNGASGVFVKEESKS